mmetsp:Transcript_26499/g.39357  ORF Transcript_26499/g.39357 Transcript_26499/m.39357 type:complete len:1086 (+) Transcript_26499:1100-4357(+)
MLIKIEEGRFKFTCTNTVDVPALVSSVLDRLPCAGDSTSSPTGTIQVNQHVETRMILCDSKALSFVLENSLTYAINIIRRKVKEMQGKLRRQVPCSEFRAVEISVDSMSRKHKEGAQGPPDCLVIRITFGAHNSIPQSSLNVALRKLSPAYEVNVETILPEWECTSYGTPKNRKTGGRTRLSTILLTAKQMLGSCGGSVQLFEVPVGQDRDPGGVVSVIDLKVPCVLRDDLATTVVRSDDTQLDHVKGSFDMGFLIKDNEFYAYGLRLFRMCNVRCCRISDPSDRDSIHNYAAIVTDSLNTYARLRVQGYRGKVIVMSAAAVYIDGSSTRQTCDYVLPVPCQLSEVKDVVSSLSNDKVIQSKLKTIRPKTRPIEAFLRKHTDIPIVYFLLMVKSFLRRWYIACTHNLQELGAFFRSRITDSDKNESQLGHHFDTDQSVWCSPFINRRVEAEFFESRLLSTVGGVITPRCSVLGILKLIEFVVLASIHPQSTHWLLPNLLTAVLILSVYAFNFEWVRGRIALTTYWNSAAMIVVGLSFFQAMTLVVSLATVFREEMSSHNFRYNMCGEYSCLQALCLVLFYPLMAHTLWTLGFGLRMAIALLMMYCAITITSLILVAPKLDLNWPVVALLLVVALFTVSAVFAMIQCEQWQRIAFQNSKRSNFSLKFISKCTELVWKELRNPLNTVLDYHEEYMKYIAKCISAQSVQMTPSLMQCLTSYRLGNLVLHEIQTVLKLKESLDSDGCREELRNRRHLEYAIKDEIHNLGRVFETESPLCIKVYIRICKSIPNRVKLDKEICQTVLVHSMSQAVNCIKTLVNNHPRAVSFVHEIVVTATSYFSDDILYIKFETIDSGMQLPDYGDANSNFQEDVCRRAIESLGGVFTRRQYAHHVYQNMVSFSLPVEFLSDAKGHPTSPFCRNIHQGYRQSGGRYALLLDKYIQRNSGKVGKVPKSFRNISPANPTCKILIAVSGQVSIISNCFRIQGWDCWEVSCHQQILSFDALDEMDVVLVEKEVDIKFMQANGGRTIAAAIKEAFPDVCMVSFVNNKPSNIGDYDAVVSRPFVDADVENIFKTCNSLAIRTLLWIQ